MTDEFVDKGINLLLNRTTCSWFQFFAQETWDRIGFVRTRRGLKIHETTITQNLLFEYQIAKQLLSPLTRKGWDITMLEAVNESRNGNDIELFVNVNGSLMFFALQAKIINHSGAFGRGIVNGNYRYIPHEVGGRHQIDLLIDYARRKGGLPLYLLYNYVRNTFDEKTLCKVNFGIEQYGCSIVSAPYIKSTFYDGTNWEIPTFNDLHPGIALPWFVIPCCFMNSSQKEILQALGFGNSPEFEVKGYKLAEVMNDKDWKPIKPFNETSKNDEDVQEEEEPGLYGDKNIEFNPKFRIIVSPQSEN